MALFIQTKGSISFTSLDLSDRLLSNLSLMSFLDGINAGLWNSFADLMNREYE